ncbi:hypothetical protein RF11_05241 [Thelohanellus kitauei]|uniref:Uncharacterized protein n=1 Tax=Thelohanellus kitauei TaxID=669202 RepID=A0A0C2MH33_THEKT|nr:hypothetical protein RF11_05241 [Thelohanellus kitauei]
MRFRLVDVVIQFACSNRTCQIVKNYELKELPFYSNAVVYPCENDDHDYTYINDTCALLKTDYPSLKITLIIVSTIMVLVALLTMCLNYRRGPKSIEVLTEQDGHL